MMKLDKALLNYYRAFQIDENFYKTNYNLGYLLWRVNRNLEAINFLRRPYSIINNINLLKDIRQFEIDIEKELRNGER